MPSDFLLIALFLVMTALFVRMAAAAVRIAYQLSHVREADAPQVFHDSAALAHFRPGRSGLSKRKPQKTEVPERGSLFPLPVKGHRIAASAASVRNAATIVPMR